LARLRRERELHEYRVEERLRQRECRARRREAGLPERGSTPVSRPTLSAQVTELQEIILEKWDQELQRSRASLARHLKVLVKENQPNPSQGGTKEPVCHVPP
jgi:hypothetical protein